MKYISLNWTLVLKFSVGNKKIMRDCRILMAHDCIIMVLISSIIITRNIKLVSTVTAPSGTVTTNNVTIRIITAITVTAECLHCHY